MLDWQGQHWSEKHPLYCNPSSNANIPYTGMRQQPNDKQYEYTATYMMLGTAVFDTTSISLFPFVRLPDKTLSDHMESLFLEKNDTV